jgi:hypothetical protein
MRATLLFGLLLAASWGGMAEAAAPAPNFTPVPMASADLLAHFVPKDVLDAVHALPDEEKAKACQGDLSDKFTLATLMPQAKLAGETSQMRNVDEDTAANLEAFAQGISTLDTAALVRGDDAQKTLAIKVLAKWAKAGAYLDTSSCYRVNCPPEWKTHRGTELSTFKDSDTADERMIPTIFGYYATLADFKRDELAADHKIIEEWLAAWQARLSPSSFAAHPQVNFGFGLNWQEWAVQPIDLMTHGEAAFRQRLQTVGDDLDKLLLPDGSMYQRTVRGSRATWYHYAALNETLVELEILRANGIDLYPKYVDRIDKAVKIFLDTIDDIKAGRNTAAHPATIYQWAKADYHSAGDPIVQDFQIPGEMDGGASSWMYIYLLRFPDGDNARRLRALIPTLYNLPENDPIQNINYGCLYRLADPALRAQELQQGIVVDEDKLASLVPLVDGTKPAAPAVTMTIDSMQLGPRQQEDPQTEGFDVTLAKPTLNGKATFPVRLNLEIKFRHANSRSPDDLDFVRFHIPKSSLLSIKDETRDFRGCGDMAASDHDIRLHYGREQTLNQCVFSEMEPEDATLFTAIYDDVPGWIHAAAASDPTMAMLDTLFTKKIAQVGVNPKQVATAKPK